MTDQNETPHPQGVLKPLVITALVTAIIASGATALLANIFDKKQEANNPFSRVVELDDETEDPEIWGKNFPMQYDGYMKTVDQVRTRFGGSEAVPRTPTDADPRAVISQSKIEEDPRLKTLWAGYAFSRDFREERGHAYMLEDQLFTERQQVKQPGTCLHCHASIYLAYKKAGDGDLIKGFEKINPMPYMEAKNLVKHPIACIDCHDPKTMALRVTRPGFIEGIAAFKESQGIKGYDVNTMATRAEMRSYVCGQCHVEYYFKGPEKHLPLGERPEGRPDPRVLHDRRRQGLQGLVARGDWSPDAQGAASRVRDVEPGDPRAQRRRMRRLPHALHARGRPEDQRSPCPQPAAQHEQRVPDLPQVVRGRDEGARRDDPGAHLGDAQPFDGRAHGAHQRHQGSEAGWRFRGSDHRGAGGAA